jgi:outer membrane lipoprotein SlyB
MNDAFNLPKSTPGRSGELEEDAINSLRRAAGLTENVLRDSTGSTLDHIADTFKRDIKDFEATGNLSKHLYHALYDYYQDDMPYGARTGEDADPHEWIADRITQDLGLESSRLTPFEKFKLRNNAARAEMGMEPNPDFKEERDPHSVDGGMDNELLYDDDEEKNSSVMPTLAGSAAGGAAGYALGSGALNSIGSSVPSAPIAPPVMVEKDMDRMKELAGVKTTDETLTLTGLAGNMTADSVATGTNDAAFTAGKVAGIPKAAVDSFKSGYKDTTTTTDEGWKGQLAGGTVGTLAGAAAGGALGPLGAAIGGAAGGTAGQMIGDKLGGKEETDESPLKGQYGHSGKMQAVDKDTSFLDRLKELSGMAKS